MVTEKVEQEKQTIDVRVEQDSNAKAVKKLKASHAWAAAEEKRRELLKQRNEFYRVQFQKWLNWTFGNLHRASNRTTFYYLVWTPTIIFWTAMIVSAVPNAIACPKPDGICHNTRMMALSLRTQVTAIPRFFVSKLKF